MYILAIFLPLIGFLLAGSIAFIARGKQENTYKKFESLSWYLTTFLMYVSAIIIFFMFSNVVIAGNTYNIKILDWIKLGNLSAEWSLYLDTLSVVMLLVVSIVSSLVHTYSFAYMKDDPHISRFQSYLSLFTFFMYMLVTSNNILQMFFGWEGVGLASYLLIGFWFKKDIANRSAIKAFIVNRVGDISFLMGIFLIYIIFDSLYFADIFNSPGLESSNYMLDLHFFELNGITAICLLLFGGAMGKSAQLGLHVWLPDAMEGPTPVSALIHAATMVTAGVFMVTRFSYLFEYSEVALSVITVIGALTAIFGASVACVQNDIKRIIAFSTASQLGYMFFAIGVSAYPASMFHLMTHAFFKALLFLGAGSVIVALHHQQDINKTPRQLWRSIPITYALIWVGSLAIAGFPPFAGYYSKDIILESVWASGTLVGKFAFVVGVISATLTAFYSWRLIFKVFHNNKNTNNDLYKDHAIKENGYLILAPMFVLAIGAVASGFYFYEDFVGSLANGFWKDSIFILSTHDALEQAHHVPTFIKKLPLMVSLFGILVSYVFYVRKPSIPANISNSFSVLHGFFYKRWYFDEVYKFLIVKPFEFISVMLWKKVDIKVVDRFGPNFAAYNIRLMSKAFSRLHSGIMSHYIIVMLSAIFIVVGIFIFK